MDANKWPQNFQDVSSNTSNITRKAIRSQEQLNCPRCNSTNTKFCYYNNYSLTQPRYFCKTCRRYWTEGGSLRNVPVGGGSRKNKRSTISSSVSSNPKIYKGQDGNLAFQVMHKETEHDMSHQYVEEPVLSKSETNNNNMSTVSALDLLRTGIASRGLDSFNPTPIPDSNTLFSSGFPLLQDIKPGTLSFSIDLGIGNGFGNNVHHHAHGVQENGTGSHGRLFFPFGELKQLSSASTEVDQNKGQGTATGYWNGMLGGGSW